MDALELMKNSVLFPQIKDKKLGLSIIQAYASVKKASILYTTYQDTKKEKNDRIDKNPEITQVLAKKLPFDLLWSYLLTTREGYNLLTQIPDIVDVKTFDSLLKEINTTIQAIEQYK